jgi:hypothetical protein
MLNIKTAAVAIALAFASSAFAQTTTPPAKDPAATPRIDQRQENQQKRIDAGVKSGQLTEREAARMDKRQDKLQADKEKAQADGVVTKKERARLHNEADRNSAAIARQKHDRQHK